MDRPQRTYKYYDLLLGAFVCVLLCSNLIGVRKLTELDLPFFGPTPFSAANLFFPLAYLFGDLLTEVYGYARSRRVVWAGFAALGFASLQSVIIVHLPPAASFTDQHHIEWAYGSTWRIALASLVAYFAGEFVNSFVMARLKIITEGKKLWMRTIGSTMAGESVDTLIFYPLAFFMVWPTETLIQVMILNYFIKVGWEVLATPITYRVVAFFKRAENEDYFDRNTKFTPFSLKVD